MKILYHHRTRSKDGQSVHIDELIAALRRRGHEVVVVEPGGAAAAEFGAGGVGGLKRLLPGAVYEMLELAYSFAAYRRLSRACRRHRPDVLYERYNLYLLAGRWLARRRGLKFLLEVNAPLLEERRKFDGIALPRLAAWTQRQAWR